MCNYQRIYKMLLNIDHYNICAPSDQLDVIKSFYVNILGLSVGYRPSLNKNGYWLYQGEKALLHLSVDDSVDIKQSGGCFNHIAFRCQAHGKILKILQKNQIKYELRELPELRQIQIFFRDPGGIRIELNYRDEVLEN